MKTAISVPDDIFSEAEHLAKRLNTSRSELYSRALAEFVARHSPDEVTETMNRVVEQMDAESAEFRRAAARKVFERTEW